MSSIQNLKLFFSFNLKYSTFVGNLIISKNSFWFAIYAVTPFNCDLKIRVLQIFYIMLFKKLNYIKYEKIAKIQSICYCIVFIYLSNFNSSFGSPNSDFIKVVFFDFSNVYTHINFRTSLRSEI